MSHSDDTTVMLRGQGAVFVTCAYCGAPADVVDHIRPRADRGRHNVGNLADACAACNSAKGSKPIAQWLCGIVLDRFSDDRNLRIVERLRTGLIAEQIGPPGPGWMVAVSEDEEAGIFEEPPSSLEAAVMELAFHQILDHISFVNFGVRRMVKLFGADWDDGYEHLWHELRFTFGGRS